MKAFNAIRITESNGVFNNELVTLTHSDLPKGDVLIKVMYSSLNYKDYLSSIGNRGVTRNYPHTPGIDAAGIVELDETNVFKSGDEVIVTGFDLGMNTHGGLSEYILVPQKWVIRKPANLLLKEAMTYGTAGFTASLSVDELLTFGLKKDGLPILVTGASGGVGSVGILILKKLGYPVAGLYLNDGEESFLEAFGIKTLIHADHLKENKEKAMLRPEFQAVLDTVGGPILEDLIKRVAYRGVVTTCGNIGGASFTSSIYPFILRGVRLIGIDSVEHPYDLRNRIWDLIANDFKLDELDSLTNLYDLKDVPEVFEQYKNKTNKGRYVIKVS